MSTPTKNRVDINAILRKPFYKGYSDRGADMGRRSDKEGTPEKLHLQQMRLHGDYDAGGAYWGHTPGTAIYCAFSPKTTENDSPMMVFTRASSREEAKEQILAELPGEGWSFFR